MRIILAAALVVLCLTYPIGASAQERGSAPGVSVKVLARQFKGKSAAEREMLITQLRGIESEEAGRLLLKILKENLSRRRGHETEPFTHAEDNMIIWGSTLSENQLLVNALYARQYRKALPTFRKMLKIGDRRTGMSSHVLAEYIYKLTGESSRFKIGKTEVTYPEQ